MNEKPRYIIGIDPDVEKSGVACIDTEEKKLIQIEAMSFWNLSHFLLEIAGDYRGKNVIIVIEDSDDTSNWHIPANASKKLAAAIGHNVGMCHATQRHIKEMAEAWGLKTEQVKPLKKNWMGRDGKITQEEISQFIPGLPKRMNQECRDAVLLAWCYANLPIHIPASFYTNALKKK